MRKENLENYNSSSCNSSINIFLKLFLATSNKNTTKIVLKLNIVSWLACTFQLLY